MAVLASLLFIIVALLPYIINSDYVGDAKVELNTAPCEIWGFANDLHRISTRLPKIAKTQILDSNLLVPRFKIYTHQGDWMLIQARIINDSSKTLTIQESSFGYTGTWAYTLQNLGNESCKLQINEKSNLNHNYWLKLLLLLGGRDMIIKEELRSIQAMAKEGL